MTVLDSLWPSCFDVQPALHRVPWQRQPETRPVSTLAVVLAAVTHCNRTEL